MKLKRFIAPILAICLAFGVCVMASACGDEKEPPDSGKENPGGTVDNDKDNPGENGGTANSDEMTLTVNIATNGANMTGIKALFYNSENSALASVENAKASAEVPKGEYTVYLTGILDGFYYTPIVLSEHVQEAELQIERATPNAEGEIPIYILYMLEPDKILEAVDRDNCSGQVCNNIMGCTNPFFDEYSICRLGRDDKQFYMTKTENEIHSPSKTMYDGTKYKFDDTKYKVPENGGFISVLFDEA